MRHDLYFAVIGLYKLHLPHIAPSSGSRPVLSQVPLPNGVLSCLK